MKIELNKQFRVPIDGLTPIAEEIIVQKEKKQREKQIGPYAEVSFDEDEKPADAPADKKQAKKAQKAQ